VFARIEREQSEDHDSLNVQYNQKYGYPSNLFVNPSERIRDEEWGTEMSDLEVISREK
jgi:hypothetical protein